MIPRIYLDTSVIGGCFDEEFSFYSQLFFDQVWTGKFKVILSDIVETELQGAPKKVIDFYHSIPKPHIEKVTQTIESIRLADEYLQEKVVGETSRTDCRHIALATLLNADVLISWNFKHIVNVVRIRGYNSVNVKYGHRLLEIRTPREILEI